MTGEPPYDWIRVRAAAKRLGIYYRTLYRRIDRGEVPAYKIVRLIRLRVHELEDEPRTPPVRVVFLLWVSCLFGAVGLTAYLAATAACALRHLHGGGRQTRLHLRRAW